MPVTGVPSPMRGVRVYANALSLEAFRELRREVRRLAEAGTAGGFHWFPFGSEPGGVVERAIVRLRRLARPGSPCAGAEWWIRGEAASARKPLHFDKDELLFKQAGRLVHPAFASVLYLNALGGGTAVCDQTISSDGAVLSPPEPRASIAISPRANQYAIFPGGLIHGVIPARATPKARATMRITLLVNYWTRPPLAASRLPPRH